MTHDLLMACGRGALAAGLALALVLCLRVPARRWLGATFAYRLWLLVPVAVLATLLPAPERPLIAALQVAPSLPPSLSAPIPLQAAVGTPAIDWAPLLFALWLAGALALVVVFVRQQRRYLRDLGALSSGEHGTLRAQATAGCPALVGALRPRIVVPSDFESRYSPRERELVLAHERTHLARGDAQINALAALLCCLNWFNPLFHIAASRFRFDQEIACDAAVMSRFPEARRSYADAMLKAQLVGGSRQELRLPAGCHWPQSHPLKERIAMLKLPVPGTLRRVLASAMLAALALSAGYASWAAQPGRSPSAEGASTVVAQSAMVQTDFAITIDGVRVGDTSDPSRRAQVSSPKSWTFGFETTRGGVAQSTADGSVSFLNRFGDTFKVSASRANERWDVEGVARDLGDGTIEFKGKVVHDGVLVSAPNLVVYDGKTAAIAVGGMNTAPAPVPNASGMAPPVIDDVGTQASAATQKGFKLDLTLRKVSDAAPSENLSYRRMFPPKYPPEAVRKQISGKVMLKVTVDEHGVPTSTEVQSVTPEESARVLSDAAIAAAMQWRYSPGMKDGKPVGGQLLVPIDFMLRDDNGAPMLPLPETSTDTSVSYRKMSPPVISPGQVVAKIDGTLYVRARIGSDGSVLDAHVDQALPIEALALKDVVLNTLKTWQFNPATRDGQAVESEVVVPFRIDSGGGPADVGVESARRLPDLTYPDYVRRLETISFKLAASG
jgi:TonB family protein